MNLVLEELIDQIGSLTKEENGIVGQLFTNWNHHDWKNFLQSYLNRQLMLRREIQDKIHFEEEVESYYREFNIEAESDYYAGFNREK